MDLFDVEALITEIQQRPVIWNAGCSEYSNREKKKSAWEEIVKIFIPKEDATVHEERDFGQHLQRRWKSLRDSYARELRLQKQTKSGTGSRKRPVYVYFKQLSFLEKVVGTQTHPNSLTDDDQHLTPTLSPPLQRSTSPVSKRIRKGPVGERLVSAEEKTVQGREQREREAENDCDRMFLLSLLNPLKEIPEYARFEVKRKMMDLLGGELQFYGQTAASTTNTHALSCVTENFSPGSSANTSPLSD